MLISDQFSITYLAGGVIGENQVTLVFVSVSGYIEFHAKNQKQEYR